MRGSLTNLNSAFNETDKLREMAGPARVMIHPETACDRGIADGDPVRVFNSRGECSFLAQVIEDTQVGLLVAEGLHWPSLSPGGGVNQLTSQRLTGMAGDRLVIIAVRREQRHREKKDTGILSSRSKTKKLRIRPMTS